MQPLIIFGQFIGTCDEKLLMNDDEIGIVLIGMNFKSVCKKLPEGNIHICFFSKIAIIERNGESIHEFFIIDYLKRIENIMEGYKNSEIYSHIGTMQ